MACMDEKPRRRWFRFSLRTLFVVVTLAALCLWIVRLFERPSIPNLAAVETGMTPEQVHGIMGQPLLWHGSLYRWTEEYHWPHAGTVEVHYYIRRVDTVEIVEIE
jgi:hypothetical protein